MSATDAAEGTECPTCGRDDFASEQGMKIHHSQAHGESIAGKSHECIICGTEFRRPPSQANKATYCSNDCRLKAQSNSVLKTCQNCGDEYKVVMSQADESRYCCLDCKSAAQTIGDVVECENCGQRKHRPPSHSGRFCSQKCASEYMKGTNHPSYDQTISECPVCEEEFSHKPSHNRVYCSEECLSQEQSWGTYEDYYGPNWNEKRTEARDRDQHRCQGCMMSEREHLEKYGKKNPVHHIRKISTFSKEDEIDYESANELDNLITLCCRCHPKWEQMTPLRPDVDVAQAD